MQVTMLSCGPRFARTFLFQIPQCTHISRGTSTLSRPSRHFPPFSSKIGWRSFRGTAASLAALSMIFYLSIDHKPVLLDSGDSSESKSIETKLDIRELTPWVPYSMHDVNEYLRLRQQSTAIGASSGLLRLDIAQAESNMPTEDTVGVLAVMEDDDQYWFLLGAYDGHW